MMKLWMKNFFKRYGENRLKTWLNTFEDASVLVLLILCLIVVTSPLLIKWWMVTLPEHWNKHPLKPLLESVMLWAKTCLFFLMIVSLLCVIFTDTLLILDPESSSMIFTSCHQRDLETFHETVDCQLL